MKKAMHFVLSLFMLAVAVYPIAGEKILSGITAGIHNGIEESDSSVFKEKSEEYLLNSAENMVTEQVNGILSELCQYEYHTEITVSLTDSGEVQLNHISVVIEKGDSSAIVLIKTRIGSLTGLVPEVQIQ